MICTRTCFPYNHCALGTSDCLEPFEPSCSWLHWYRLLDSWGHGCPLLGVLATGTDLPSDTNF